MGALNQFLSDNLAVIVTAALLLIIVLGVLNLIVQQFSNRQQQFEIDNKIAELRRTAEHYADVSAVVTMMGQLDELDQEAIESLKSYPEAVRSAAMLHYINLLGADLQYAQKHLSANQRKYVGLDTIIVKNSQACVDHIRAKLDAAVTLSKDMSVLHTV